MPKNKSDIDRLVISEIDYIIAAELGLWTWLKDKEIHFNPRPFKNPEPTVQETTRKIEKPFEPPSAERKTGFVEFHMEIAKKVDALLEQIEKETKLEEQIEIINLKTKKGPITEIIELREPFQRRPSIFAFKSEIPSNDVFKIVKGTEELFDIDLPKATQPDFKIINKLDQTKEFHFVKKLEEETPQNEQTPTTQMFNDTDDSKQKIASAFANIKVRNKEERQKQKEPKEETPTFEPTTNGNGNGIIKTEQELENTKHELEEKKKQLEEAEKEAKHKMEELKKKKAEKIKNQKEQEKLKKLEIKKQKIEQKKMLKEQKKQQILEAKQHKLEQKMLLKKQKEEQKLQAKQQIIETKTETQNENKTEKKPLFSFLKKKETKPEPKDIFKPVPTPKRPTTKQQPENETIIDEVRQVLQITDSLLDKLPEEIIEQFANSKEFELYEKVLTKYKIKEEE